MTEPRVPHPPGLSDQMFAQLYENLRDLAGRRMRHERTDHTLRPTELVHEVFIRLSDAAGLVIQNRQHFLAIAGRVMQQVLVDYARRRATLKHGGGLVRVTLDEWLAISDDRSVEILELDDALKKLAEIDATAAEVVVHRFFGGLTEAEIGELNGRSERWVRNQWSFARAWLRRELDRARG